MQKYFNNVTNRTGDVVPAARVTVTNAATGALATIYADNGVTPAANPLTADNNGYFSFYAADGRYTLTITGTGISTLTIADLLLEDVSAQAAAAAASAAASDADAMAAAASAADAEAAVASLSASGGSALVGYLPAGTGAVSLTVQSKLRDLEINVNDFGADPTGASNSYAAFVAAIAATPIGGTLRLNGTYRCSTGLVITKPMTIAGADHRVGNVPDGALSKSFLYFDTDVSSGIDIQGCVVTVDGVVVSGIGASSTGYGIRSRNPNNSLILAGGSVVQGFNRGVSLEQGYYNKIDNATITYCVTCLFADNVYNLTASALTIRPDGAYCQGITLLNGSQMTMLGGSIENATVYGVAAADGSNLTLVGTYLENSGGWDVYLGTNASANIVGCHVYANTGTSRFVSVEGGSATGVRVYSRNNRIVYPTDTRTFTVYQPVVNDATCYWDVAGDNWASPIGANVTYTPGGWFALEGNVSFQFPAGHPNYGKNFNTVPYCADPAISAMSGTPKGGTEVFWGNAGYAGDDPIGLRSTGWGYNSYAAVYQKGQWEKVGLRLPNQTNSAAATVADLVADFNALLAKLRAAGVMV